MRKRFFVFAVFFASFAALTSCTSAPVAFDETLPDEAMATIYWFGNNPRPVAYNGINVNWRLRGHFLGFINTYNPIKIPAGHTTFEITGRSVMSDGFGGRTTWNWNQFTFSFYFSEGGSYTIFIPMGSVIINEGKSVARRAMLTSFSPQWN